MDNDQDAASLSEALVQVSLSQDTVAMTTSTAIRDPLTLLSIPLEIRQLIYQYFLKTDKAAKTDDLKAVRQFDLRILCLCRQLRSEGLEYIAKNNMWILLSVLSDREVDLGADQWNVPLLPQHILKSHELEVVLSHKALSVELSKTIQIGDIVQDEKVRSNLLFAYTLASFTIICEALVNSMIERKLALSIAVPPKFSDRNHTIVEDLVLPFTVIRDIQGISKVAITGVSNLLLSKALVSTMNKLNSSAGHFQDHLLALKEEGNRFFAKGHYGPAIMHYQNAIAIYQRSIHGNLLTTPSSQAEVNVVRSIFTDVANNWMHTSNILVMRCRDSRGVLFQDLLLTMLDIVAVAGCSLAWLGMSNQQHQKAHYRCAVALQNLGDYCSDPENAKHMYRHHVAQGLMARPVDPEFHFQIATQQYFFSLHADMFSKSAPYIADVYRKMGDKHNCYITESPVLSVVRDVPNYEGGTWEGDPSLRNGRTDEQMRTELQSSVARDDKTMTKKELKKMKRDLGMPGDQIDGLVRLLRPE